MGANWAFAPCCTHRILSGPWPEALASWWQQAALLTLTLSPACSDNKIFPWCWLSLDHCAEFRSGAVTRAGGAWPWATRANGQQCLLPAPQPASITCLQLSMLGLGSRGWASPYSGCPQTIRRLWAFPVPHTVAASPSGTHCFGLCEHGEVASLPHHFQPLYEVFLPENFSVRGYFPRLRS